MPGESDIKAGGAYVEISSGLAPSFGAGFNAARGAMSGLDQHAATMNLNLRRGMMLVSAATGESTKMFSQMAMSVMMIEGPAGLAMAAIIGIKGAWEQVSEASDRATAAMQKSIAATTAGLDKAFKFQHGKKDEFNVNDAFAEGNKALQDKHNELQKLKESADVDLGPLGTAHAGTSQFSSAYADQQAQLEQDIASLEAAQNGFRNAMRPTAIVNEQMRNIHQGELAATPRGVLGGAFEAPSETGKAEHDLAKYTKQKEALGEYLYALERAGVKGELYEKAQEKYAEVWREAAVAKKVLTDATLKQTEATLKAVEAEEKEKNEFEKKIADQVEAGRKAARGQAEALYEETRTPLEKLNAKVRGMLDLSNMGAINDDTLMRGVALELGKVSKSEFSAIGTFSGAASGQIGANGVLERQLQGIEGIDRSAAELVRLLKNSDNVAVAG